MGTVDGSCALVDWDTSPVTVTGLVWLDFKLDLLLHQGLPWREAWEVSQSASLGA